MTTTIKRRDAGVSFFHALSDDTRLEIMENLKDGERCVCDLTDALKTGQSRLSFHLKVLKDAGLTTDRPEGRWTYYALNRDALEELERWFKHYRGHAQEWAPPPLVGSFCSDE